MGSVNRLRPHKKSRSGCSRCKSRKIKCDETKPQCSQCQRYSTPCDYQSGPRKPSSRSSDGSGPKSSISPTPTELPVPASKDELSEQTTALGVTDLQLLHNWSLEAYKGFGSTVNEEVFWQRDLPNVAFVYPFLLHSLLAISSLHLARLHGDRKEHFLAVAADHESKALPAYRAVIRDFERSIDEQKGQIMVAFASLTTVYALLCSQSLDSSLSEGQHDLSRLLDSFELLRGARNILGAIGNCTEGCTIGSQINTIYGDIDCAINPDDGLLTALEPLIRNANHTSNVDSLDLTEANLAALNFLRWCFAALCQPLYPIGIKEVLTIWVELIPQRFLDSLKELHPGALIVLAHWCILLKRAHMYWYLKGSAEKTVASIFDLLDDFSRACITWPMETIYGFT